METTITIDDDIVAKLSAEMQKQKKTSFKEIVNETLRIGLQAKQEIGQFKIRPRSMGKREHLNYDKINELIEEIESGKTQ